MREGRNLKWHAAFFEALKLEFYDYKEHLSFADEVQLSEEALRMDVLVVKKDADIEIDKNIGKIFRRHNIFEFKSEKDNISVDDFYKVYAYALLYKSFQKLDLSGITLNFVTTRHPRELMKHLKNARKYKVREIYDGIYCVEGDIFPIQIIENKKLDESENIWLKNLRSNLSAEDLSEVLERFQKQGNSDLNNAYIFRIIEANIKQIEEAMKMTETEVYKVIVDTADRLGMLEELKMSFAKQAIEQGIEQGIKKGKEEGKKEGKKEGKEEGKKEGKEEAIKDVILKLKQSAIMSNEQIAQILGLPRAKVEQLQ